METLKDVLKMVLALGLFVVFYFLFLKFMQGRIDCFFNTFKGSTAIVEMDEAKKLDVFLNEYRAIPNVVWVGGNQAFIYSAWTERAWNFEGPCGDKLVFKDGYKSLYHFNIEGSPNWQYDPKIRGKYRLKFPFIKYDSEFITHPEIRWIERYYLYSEIPDTLVVSLDSVINFDTRQTTMLRKVLFVKVPNKTE